ncbi:MAG TPA: hypothetical protein DCQ36_00940 [Actinobacteria bacterium]|nr:hypothetical protein [Actinomycetota bacterium]
MSAGVLRAGGTCDSLSGGARLELIDVHAAYGEGIEVLESISLQVPPRRVTVVLGANSSGKTTLARVAAGQMDPLRGEVRLTAERWQAIGDARVAALIDGHLQLDREATSRRPAAPSWHKRVITRLALEDGSTAMSPRMSSSERRRSLLSRALLSSADVLVLDEPCTTLDPRHQTGLVELLREVQEQPVAALLLTSSIELARALGASVGLLDKGVLTWRHVDDLILEGAWPTRVEGVAPLRPSGSTRFDGLGPVYQSDVARLAAVVRSGLNLRPGSEVVIQQSVAGAQLPSGTATIVTVPGSQFRSWIFPGGVADLSPHALGTAITLNPEGNTHAISH